MTRRVLPGSYMRQIREMVGPLTLRHGAAVQAGRRLPIVAVAVAVAVVAGAILLLLTAFLAGGSLALGPQQSVGSGAVPVPTPAYWPTQGWRTSTPEEQGLDSGKLADVLDYVRQKGINLHSVQIVRNGYLVLNAYFYPFDKDSVHDVASVTKSVTSLLVGVAIKEGKISSVGAPLLQFFPGGLYSGTPVHDAATSGDPRKGRVTLEDLLTMTSGLDCQEGADEKTLNEMKQSQDWVQFMLHQPMAAEPGTKFNYCSGGMHLLSGVVSRATGTNELDLARRTLFEPLGIHDVIWPSDPQGVSRGWGDLHLHPTDMAKIGYLYLNRGLWDGKQIVDERWVAASTAPHVTADKESDYGYGWWVKARDPLPTYQAQGRGGQRIIVVPSKNIVVVMTGGGFEPGDLGALLGAAITSDAPLPENADGATRLQAATEAAARPGVPLTPQSPPPLATTISGTTYALTANPLGLHTLSLSFPAAAEAMLRLGFADGHTEEHLAGLDGVERLSTGGTYGLPVGLRGRWQSPQVFVLDYDEIANINSNQITFSFSGLSGENLEISVTERTSGSHLNIEGHVDGR